MAGKVTRDFKLGMSGDASGLLGVFRSADREQKKFQQGLKETEKAGQGLLGVFKSITGGVITGGLHRLGAMITNAIVAPFKLGLDLIGKTISKLLEFRTVSMDAWKSERDLLEDRDRILKAQGQFNPGNVGKINERLNYLKENGLIKGDDQLAGFNQWLRATGNIDEALQAVGVAANVTAAAPGRDFRGVLQKLLQANESGTPSGMYDLGLSEKAVEHRMRQLEEQFTRQLVGQKMGRIRNPEMMTDSGRKSLTEMIRGQVAEQAREMAGQQATREALYYLNTSTAGAMEAQAARNPDKLADQRFDSAKKGFGEYFFNQVLPFHQRTAAGAGTLGDIFETAGPQNLDWVIAKIFPIARDTLVRVLKDPELQRALVELFISVKEALKAGAGVVTSTYGDRFKRGVSYTGHVLGDILGGNSEYWGAFGDPQKMNAYIATAQRRVLANHPITTDAAFNNLSDKIGAVADAGAGAVSAAGGATVRSLDQGLSDLEGVKREAAGINQAMREARFMVPGSMY